MPNTIFFSWQADRPTKEGRNLVERALERAIDKIGSDTKIEEAIRDLKVDRDTKGVPGSPPIVDTIFRKIDEAAVFVPDLTFVGTRPDGRPTPNPNVLIEYGWALKSLGHGLIVPIMNTAFGEPTPDAMPFDMRHLRNPVQYNCPVDASDEARKHSRETLAKELERRIREVLVSNDTKPKQPDELPAVAFLPREPSAGLGRFRQLGEALGVSDNFAMDTREIKLTDDPVVWFRLMPTIDPGRAWKISELRNAASRDGVIQPLVSAWSSLNYLRGLDGFGSYAPLNAERDITNAVVFAFKTGEIWSIDTYILNALGRQQNIIPPMENDFKRALKSYSDFLLYLGIKPPFRWIAGMENLKSRGLTDSRGRMAGFRGPSGYCLTDIVTEEGIHHPDNLPEKSIEPFFAKLFESCGLERLPELG
jgi:hypothetical protein